MRLPKILVISAVLLVMIALAMLANSDPDIADLIGDRQELSILNEALNTAGLADSLKEEGPYTFFAPTNEGFKSLPDGRLDELLQSDDKTELQDLLRYHMVGGAIRVADLQGERMFETLEGDSIQIVNGSNESQDESGAESWGGKVRVNNASMVEADIAAQNGMLHIIDAVAMPSDLEVNKAEQKE